MQKGQNKQLATEIHLVGIHFWHGSISRLRHHSRGDLPYKQLVYHHPKRKNIYLQWNHPSFNSSARRNAKCKSCKLTSELTALRTHSLHIDNSADRYAYSMMCFGKSLCTLIECRHVEPVN